MIAGGLPIAHLGNLMSMKLSRNLIAFGCSLTYGHGLPDCHIAPNRPGPKASDLAWPNLLANMLEMRCTNLSKPGNSNFSIVLKMLEYKFVPHDTCVVMWTFPDRDLIIHNNQNTEQIGHWIDEKRFLTWLEVNPEQTIRLRFWSWITLVSSWLDNQGVNYYFLLTRSGQYGDPPDWAKHVKFLSPNMASIREKYPRALDNHHPGVDAHSFFAKEVFKEII